MKPPLHQRFIKIVAYILGGIILLGTILDSLANAISLLTPLIAGIGTASIILGWLLTSIILRFHPITWVVGNQTFRLRKLGIQPTAIAFGMILLLWFPLGLTLFRTAPPLSPNLTTATTPSQTSAPINPGVSRSDSLSFDSVLGETIRLKLKNGPILTGVIQPFIKSQREGFIVFHTYEKNKNLRERFGDKKTFELPADVIEPYIDLIEINKIESFEKVETNVRRGFQVVTERGKKIEPMGGFAITLEGVDKPGAVRVKYQIPGTGKLFNAGEIDVKNETISIPVTMAFISYAKENKEKVVSISKDLNNHGILTWFDDDMILPGDNWQLKIKQAIEKADYFLPFLSCQYNNRELHLAMHQQSWGPEDKRFIIPILLDDCDAPYNLKKFSAAKTSDQNWFKKLLKAIAPSHIKHTL